MLETAIQLDPDFAEAYAWKACTLHQALEFGFRDDQAEAEKEAFAAIDKALSLDENDVECHRLLCEVYMESRRSGHFARPSKLILPMGLHAMTWARCWQNRAATKRRLSS